MKKWMLGAGVVSTIAMGSLVFTGGDTINQVSTKVAGMFEDLRLYESNETKLISHIEELENSKQNLLSKIYNMNEGLENKDIIIADLENQAIELQKEIDRLNAYIENSNTSSTEIAGLKEELNKANEEVAKLNFILNTHIEGKPLTEEEMNNLVPSENKNKILFNWTEESGGELTSYAHYKSEPIKDEQGNTEYIKVTIFSVTDDGFDVEVGTDEGKSFIQTVYRGNELEFNIGKLEDGTPNWDYITISGEPRFEIGNFYNDNN